MEARFAKSHRRLLLNTIPTDRVRKSRRQRPFYIRWCTYVGSHFTQIAHSPIWWCYFPALNLSVKRGMSAGGGR